MTTPGPVVIYDYVTVYDHQGAVVMYDYTVEVSDGVVIYDYSSLI